MDLRAIRFIENTKVSHDYDGKNVDTFSYYDLISRGVPAIGIPAKQNGLVIIDVDAGGAHHKHDGREWWQNFSKEYGIPPTYTVSTRNGGFHYYFRLPQGLNPDTFRPPNQLANGVDVKYNGWVGAPPSKGYEVVYGSTATIQDAPAGLMMFMANNAEVGGFNKTFEHGVTHEDLVHLHKPFTLAQIEKLRLQITRLQQQGNLSYQEWRDGLFALKAGVEDPEILEELVDKWTYNQSYVPGDEHKAREIVERASKHAGVGPGTIFHIIKDAAIRAGSPIQSSPLTRKEILDKSRVVVRLNDKTGQLIVEPSESNIAEIIGAMFTVDELYHDIRRDHFIFKGDIYSDEDLANTLCPIIQSSNYGLGLDKIKRVLIKGAIEVLLNARRIDPHKRYLENLKWDGQQRIDTFCQKYFGVEDNPYHRYASKNIWITLAARGLVPGMKVDYMFILEGHEGIRKSSIVQAIGGREYTYAPSDKKLFEKEESLRRMHQSIVTELPELLGILGQDGETIKGILSSEFDTVRSLFAKRATPRPRGFVFFGTTNRFKYLTRSMGLRRFIPIRIPDHVRSFDIANFEMNRDQLFAEGVHRFKEGENFYKIPDEIHLPVVRMRVKSEPLKDAIRNVVETIHGMKWSPYDVYQRLEAAGAVPRGYKASLAERIEDGLAELGMIEHNGLWSRPVLNVNDFI